MLLLVLCLCWSSCQEESCDDPTDMRCPNYDPCLDTHETSAYFTISENPGINPPLRDDWFLYIDSDTVYQSSITFIAQEKDATYTWYIGRDTFYDRSVSLWGFPGDQSFEVTLVVERTPDSACFPDDDGKARLTRTFYRREEFCEASIVGKYRLHPVDEPAQEFDFELLVCTAYGPPLYGDYYLLNIDGQGCSKPVPHHLRTNYEYTFSASSFECGAPIGHLYLLPEDRDHVYLTYALRRGDNQGDTLRFEGYRIR